MGIKDFFPWLEAAFPNIHLRVSESNSKRKTGKVNVIIDLTGEWRNIRCFVWGPTDFPDGISAPDISKLTRFFPNDVLRHLDQLICSATHGINLDTEICVWIVTDDSEIPVHIKEETRAVRRASIAKRLATTKADTISYRDVDRIYGKSLSFSDGRTSRDPIVADVFCSKASRPFRVKLLEWLIDQALFFKWAKADKLQLNFVVEGVEPVTVLPVCVVRDKGENKSPETETVTQREFRSNEKIPLDLPLRLCAEADVFIQHLVRHISSTDDGKAEIIVNAVDSDICALLIGWTMDHYLRRRDAPDTTAQVPMVSFFRFYKDSEHEERAVSIHVNALARYLALERQLPVAAFIGGCILTGTDFFQRERVLYRIGSSHVLEGIIGVAEQLSSPFSVENKEHFEQLLVAAILSKENKLERFNETYNRSLASTRNWLVATKKKIPAYVPDKWIYDRLRLEEKKEDADAVNRQDKLVSSYRKIPAVYTKGHHWPTEAEGARSVHQAFIDNYEYWAPAAWNDQQPQKLDNPSE